MKGGAPGSGMGDPLILCPHVTLEYPGTPQTPKSGKTESEITPNIGVKIVSAPYRNKIVEAEIHNK